MTTPTCPQCHATYPAEALYCARCGAARPPAMSDDRRLASVLEQAHTNAWQDLNAPFHDNCARFLAKARALLATREAELAVKLEAAEATIARQQSRLDEHARLFETHAECDAARKLDHAGFDETLQRQREELRIAGEKLAAVLRSWKQSGEHEERLIAELAALRASVAPMPYPYPLPIHGCKCDACEYLRRKQREYHQLTQAAEAQPVPIAPSPPQRDTAPVEAALDEVMSLVMQEHLGRPPQTTDELDRIDAAVRAYGDAREAAAHSCARRSYTAVARMIRERARVVLKGRR